MRVLALVLHSPPLVHPEAVLLVDDGQAQPGERHIVLEQGVGAHGDLGLARGQRRQLPGPRRALVATGQQHHAHALGLERGGDGVEMLASEDLGRRHQSRLQPGVGGVGHGQHADHGLARPHIALQQAAHPLAGLEVAADLGQRHGLAAGEAEGQGGLEQPGCGPWRDDGRGLSAARALALGHGQLMSEQFVIGQAAALRRVQQGVGFGLGRMQALQRLAPAGEALAGLEGWVLPFRRIGRPFQRLVRQPANRARGQARGRGIDGFEGRDLVQPLGRQDIVGVVDLELDPELPALDLAADRPQGPFGVLALKAVAEHLEIDQEKESRLVGDPDPVGLAGPSRRQVRIDTHQEDLGLALASLRRRGPVALHHTRRRQEQQVPHQRPGQALDQWRDLRPHALQRGGWREQGKENLRPHGASISHPPGGKVRLCVSRDKAWP